jgi:hypothetical protein
LELPLVDDSIKAAILHGRSPYLSSAQSAFPLTQGGSSQVRVQSNQSVTLFLKEFSKMAQAFVSFEFSDFFKLV